MVIRRTLGATRSTLAGKALLESLMLSLLGAGISWLVAPGLIGLIKEVGLQESLARADRFGRKSPAASGFALPARHVAPAFRAR